MLVLILMLIASLEVRAESGIYRIVCSSSGLVESEFKERRNSCKDGKEWTATCAKRPERGLSASRSQLGKRVVEAGRRGC